MQPTLIFIQRHEILQNSLLLMNLLLCFLSLFLHPLPLLVDNKLLNNRGIFRFLDFFVKPLFYVGFEQFVCHRRE